MVEYEWFSYELIQYVSSDCIVLYLYAHIDYKDTWFSHELTQYVSLDFPFGKLNWFNVNLQISLCSKFFMALNTMISDFLMDWFNMSIQMSLLFSFIFTEITSVLDIFMDWFIMSLQNSLCCCLPTWLSFAGRDFSVSPDAARLIACCRKRCSDCALLTSASRHLPLSFTWCDQITSDWPSCCHPSGCRSWRCWSRPSVFRQS